LAIDFGFMSCDLYYWEGEKCFLYVIPHFTFKKFKKKEKMLERIIKNFPRKRSWKILKIEKKRKVFVNKGVWHVYFGSFSIIDFWQVCSWTGLVVVFV